ncbi:MAG: bi-domain-containing oxidoreductase [Myxococcota bacterium]|nr:bi-domain-containing oxidoreductase [Myxococcota bacterium]
MKQVLFDRAGVVHVDDVPAPAVGPDQVLVRVAHSVISTGTETAGYASGGLASEVASNPKLVSRVVDQVRSTGLRGAANQVRDRLNERRPRGYAGSGFVVAAGPGMEDLTPGTRVAYGGEPHAEYVAARRNLIARVPAGVAMDQAAVTTIGSIALHGLRLAHPGLGETVVVLGLGLVGQLAVALARAMGLHVAGGDPVASRVELARRASLDAAIDVTDVAGARSAIQQFTGGIGADAVLVCAGGGSSKPTALAAELCRDRGRVVVIGAAGLELDRSVFYRKELSLQVSRSYGPGRYDPSYEDRGQDYPVGYVRWTENRNFSAFLSLLERGAIDVAPLLSTRFAIADAPAAYAALKRGPDAPLTAVLDYPVDLQSAPLDVAPTRQIRLRAPKRSDRELRLGLVGCGAFARAQIIPALRRAKGVRIAAVCASSGASAANVARLVDAELCTTDHMDLLSDETIDAVVIATRHDLHHAMAMAAAVAGKPFHVEKPLALTTAEAAEIVTEVQKAGIPAVVGFNRRSAPFIVELRDWLSRRAGPAQILIRVNANPVPADHWTLDPVQGGGRLVGEGCHFLDLAAWLGGSAGRVIAASALPGNDPADQESNLTSVLRFADGSLATVQYGSRGHSGLPKERIEVAWDGCCAVIDDFRRMETYGIGRSRSLRTQDKGVYDHLANFLDAVRGSADVRTPVTAGLDAAERIDEIRALLRGGDER